MKQANKTQFEQYEAFREAVSGMKQAFSPLDVLQALQDEWEAYVISLDKDELPTGLVTGLEMIGRDDLVSELEQNQKPAVKAGHLS